MFLFSAGMLPAEPAPEPRVPPLPPPVTRAIYRSQWFDLLDVFQDADRREAKTILDEMMKSARSIGVRRLADFSRTAVHVARKLEQAGRTGGALLAHDAAVALDDTSFDAAASRVSFLARHGRLRDALGGIGPAFTTLLGSSESRSSVLSSLALLLLAALALAAIATILGLFLRYARRIFHDLRETAARFVGGAAPPIAFLLMLLPVFFTLGPTWLLLYWAVLAFAYSERRDRIALALSLAVLAVAPLAVDALARENLLLRSPIYLAAVDYAERREDMSVEDGLASLVSAYPDQADAWFLLARYAERAGDNTRALAAYSRAIQNDPKEYRALVNRGNVRFLEGQYSEATSDYEEATRRAPNSAEAFYNLSVVRSETYDFKGQETARARALAISRRDVDAWSSAPPLSRVVPAAYPVSSARERARAWSERAGGRPHRAFPLLDVALSPLCLAPIGALLAAWIYGAIRSRVGTASQCSRCGRAFCRRCKRYGGPAQFCGNCVRLYGRKDDADEDAREADRRRIEARSTRRRFYVRVGSAILPGLHRFFAGKPLRAFAVLFVFAFLLLLAFPGPWLFDVAPLAPPRASLPGRATAVGLALILWLIGIVGAWRYTRES